MGNFLDFLSYGFPRIIFKDILYCMVVPRQFKDILYCILALDRTIPKIITSFSSLTIPFFPYSSTYMKKIKLTCFFHVHHISINSNLI
jgi:hypothetical protein